MNKSNPPQSPLVRGEVASDCRPAVEGHPPSPDKGRAGEGLGFPFLPYNKSLTVLARENRKNPTHAENLIWNKVLRGRQLSGYKFLRQKPIGGYIVDFYCSELQLVIEIDGESHAQQVEYDAERTRFLESLGLSVIRYSNRDVTDNLEGVFNDLLGKAQAVINRVWGQSE